MGKRIVKEMARALITATSPEQKIRISADLEKTIKSRRRDRDTLLLLNIFKENIGEEKCDSGGMFRLFGIIQKNATRTTSDAIAGLLLMPEMYARWDRSTRGRLLQALGAVGDCQTVEKIQASVPLFKGIRYIDQQEFGVGSPETLMMRDMYDIERAIQQIRHRCGCA